MAVTDNLAILEVASNQNNKETTINDGLNQLDNAMNAVLAVTFSANAATLTANQFHMNRNFVVSGQSATATLTVPSTTREFSVTNLDSTYPATITAGGTTVSVEALTSAIIQCNSTNLRLITSVGASGSVTFASLPASVQNAPMSLPFTGLPGDGQVFHIPLTQAYTLPANFVGSLGYAGTVPTADAAFAVGYVRAGSYHAVGTLTFAASASSVTLSTQALVNLLSTDVLRFTSPSPQDATLADCGITLLLKKV